MPSQHNDATPETLAVACPRCGRGVRERCKGPLGDDTNTHLARKKLAAKEPSRA